MRRFLAFGLIAILASAARSTAQDKSELKGFVRALDVKQGTITVEVPKKGGPQTYRLSSANVPIRDARNNPLKLVDVKPGRKVSLNFASLTDVSAIKVLPSFKVGTVVQVNAATREVELLVKKEKLRFKIAKDATYWRSERVVAPPDLKPGHRITVYYLPESNEVIVINYRDLIPA